MDERTSYNETASGIAEVDSVADGDGNPHTAARDFGIASTSEGRINGTSGTPTTGSYRASSSASITISVPVLWLLEP